MTAKMRSKGNTLPGLPFWALLASLSLCLLFALSAISTPRVRDDAASGLAAGLSASSYLAARGMHHALGKRDALRCDDGPCVDGSCCSKDKICGFGPDYCGAGCLSQCNATAMCGQYSENAEMPCGMNLCCSAMGWCGVSRRDFFH